MSQETPMPYPRFRHTSALHTALLAVLIAGCETPPPVAPTEPPPPPVPGALNANVTPPPQPLAPASGLASVDEKALDTSVSACDDFYQYACGGWLKATPIPEDRAGWT